MTTKNAEAEYVHEALVDDRTGAPTLSRRPRLFRVAAPIEGTGRSDVRRRDAFNRRVLVVADALAAIVAIYLAVGAVGDQDSLSLVTLFAAPFVVLVSKLIGLYDREELVLRRSTLDEAPALFQLATLYTLFFWLFEDQLLTGLLGHEQVLGLWISLFSFALVGRAAARGIAGRYATAERVVRCVGRRNSCHRRLLHGCG